MPEEQYEFEVTIKETPYDCMRQIYRDKGAGDIYFSIDTVLSCGIRSGHDNASSDIGIHRMSREHLKYLREEITKFLDDANEVQPPQTMMLVPSEEALKGMVDRSFVTKDGGDHTETVLDPAKLLDEFRAYRNSDS